MADIKIIMEGVDNASSVIKGIGGAIGKLGVIAAGIGAAGLGAVGAGLAVAVHEAMDAQQNMADLTATLQATGRTGLTESILETAQSLKDLAGGSDDAVIGVQNMLVGFKEIGDKTLPKATQATLDLAAKMKISTEAAADMLGPILATGDRLMGLKKANIVFTDSEKDKIKALFDAGDAAAAQQIILDKLSSTIGGTAAASAQTLGGRIEILKGHLLDAAEGIATKLLPIAEDFFTNVLEPAIPIIENVAGFVGDMALSFAQLATSGNLENLDNMMSSLSKTIAELTGGNAGEIEKFLFGLETSALNSATSLQPLLDALQNLASAFQSQMPAMQTTVNEFTGNMKSAFDEQLPGIIANITTAINTLATIWREHGDEIMWVASTIFTIIVDTILVAVGLITGILAAGLQIINGDWTGAWNTIQTTLQTALKTILTSVGTNTEEFKNTWTKIWNDLQTIVSTKTMEITANIQTWIINAVNELKSHLNDAYQFGKDFADNIIKGVLIMAANIADTAKHVVENAVKAAASALGGAASAVSGVAGKVGGFQSGGFTGVGASNEVAGVVHRNEWVVPQGGALVLRGEGDSGGFTNYGTINITMAGGETDLRALIRNLRMATI